MAKDRDPEDTVTVPLSVLKEMIAAGTREQLAAINGRNYDEKLQEELDKMRGKDRPLPPEETVACRSPISGATFTARLIISRQFPTGRIVELLDYVRPEGCDKHVSEGGKYTGPKEGMTPVTNDNPEEAQYAYLAWLYKTFFQTDWNILSGKPGSFLAQWRVTDKAAE